MQVQIDRGYEQDAKHPDQSNVVQARGRLSFRVKDASENLILLGGSKL